MSADPEELLILPLLIVIGFAIVAGVWIGGNGGDISWINEVVSTLALPAVLLGLLLAGGAVISDAI
jgi:hypothetical protein